MAQAISVIKELSKIPNLPSPKLADVGDSGVFLFLEKGLVDENALMLLTRYAEDNKLGFAKSKDHYVIRHNYSNNANDSFDP